jgi:hypothetical protein
MLCKTFRKDARLADCLDHQRSQSGMGHSTELIVSLLYVRQQNSGVI